MASPCSALSEPVSEASTLVKPPTAPPPGYSVHTEGIYTLVTPSSGTSVSITRLVRFLLRWRKWAPLVAKFTVQPLYFARRQFLLRILGALAKSLLPPASLYYSSQLLDIMQAAADKKPFERRDLAIAATGKCLAHFADGWINDLLKNNDGVLKYHFTNYIREHVMEVREKLDVIALENPRTSSLLWTVAYMQECSERVLDAVLGIGTPAQSHPPHVL
jgi:hypothetical protein